MKIETSAIERYAITQWYHKDTGKLVFGVVVKMKDGKRYNVKDDDNPVFYDNEKDAFNKISELNEALKSGSHE